MPHDRDGRILEVGDLVIVYCKITSIQPTDEYCNLTLETEEPMYPADNKSTIVLNSKQVEVLDITFEEIFEDN